MLDTGQTPYIILSMTSIPKGQGGGDPKGGYLRPVPETQSPEQFQSFQATELYCPQCHEATPTREFLLLVLPEGNLYDYRCVHCGTSTGSRTETKSKEIQIYR